MEVLLKELVKTKELVLYNLLGRLSIGIGNDVRTVGRKTTSARSTGLTFVEVTAVS